MTPSEQLRYQRELASKGRNRPKLISRSKVPLPSGFPAWIRETNEMIRGGSYTALREVFAKYIKVKKLNIPDWIAYLDDAICEGIKRERGSNSGYCQSQQLGTPAYQLINSYHTDPRGPKNLRRGIHGRDAYHWKALHLASGDGKMTPDFLENYVRAVGCGSCKSSFKTIMRNNPPDYSSPANSFAWSVLAHNLVNKKLTPQKPQVSLEDARRIWSQ